MDFASRRSLLVFTGLALASCVTTYDPEPLSERTERLYGPVSTASSVERESLTDADLPDEAALEDYLRYGLLRNGALRSDFERWKASLERITQESVLPDPRFTYAEFLEEIETRTGPQERRFGLSQSFPWPGELGARGRVASHRAEALWHEVEGRRLAVARDIAVAHHEYAFLGRNVRISADVLELLRRLEPIVQQRIRAGGGQEDLLRLQVEIGQLENEVAGLEKLRPSLSARLAAAMNYTGASPLPIPELLPPTVDDFDTEALRLRALELNPDLRALREELLRSDEAIELAGYGGKPSFTLGVDWFQTGEAVNPATSGSGDDPVAVTLSLNLPVWRSNYSAEKREAQHVRRAARERLSEAESRVRADVEAECFRADDAGRQIALYRDSLIPRARESLELTAASYRAGQASLLDWIDSERTQLRFELAYWRACRDYRQSNARLRAVIGGGQ